MTEGSVVKRVQYLGTTFPGYADRGHINPKAAKVTIRWRDRFTNEEQTRNIFVSAVRAKQFEERGR